MVGHISSVHDTHQSRSSGGNGDSDSVRAFDQEMTGQSSRVPPVVKPKPQSLQGKPLTTGTPPAVPASTMSKIEAVAAGNGQGASSLPVFRTDSRPPSKLAGDGGTGMQPFQTSTDKPGKLVTDEIDRLTRNKATRPLNELATMIKRGGSELRRHQISTSLGEAQAIPGSSGKESHLYKMDLPFTHYHMPTSGGGLETKPIMGAETLRRPEFETRFGGQALLSNNPDVKQYQDLADSKLLGLFHNNHSTGGNGEISVFGDIPPGSITHVSSS